MVQLHIHLHFIYPFKSVLQGSCYQRLLVPGLGRFGECWKLAIGSHTSHNTYRLHIVPPNLDLATKMYQREFLAKYG